MKDKLSVEWKEVHLTPDTTCKATIEGLKENQIVLFRVRAANKAGFGEPSEPTDNHTVKHRNCKSLVSDSSSHSTVIFILFYLVFFLII